jgi:endo-1,4-beta-xylanase
VAAVLCVVEPGPAAADPTPLKTLAAAARGGEGIKIGSVIRSTLIDRDSAGDETYEQWAAAEFSLIASENDLVWEAAEPTEPTREGGEWVHTSAWGRAAEVVDFAVQNGQTVIGHHLVWHSSVSGWWPRTLDPNGKPIPDPAASTTSASTRRR